jgi:hypothetical protein
MKMGTFAVAALALGSFGCMEDGDQVALNGRLFDAQSMESQGGGCSLYMLGGRATAGGGTMAMGLDVSEKQTESAIVITVARGTETVATRSYGAPFFQVGNVDELVVASPSGGNLLLRYWGRFHPGGVDGCTPLDAPAPR